MINEKELNEALKAVGQDNNGEARIVELDDTIKFDCKRCGRCCSNRNDIILNPFDVYKIAKGLSITMEEVIDKYCVVQHGTSSGLPLVILAEDERGLCPFLKFSATEGKFGCSINDFKPGACIMHPIGVVRSRDEENGKQNTQFIEVPSCSIHGTNTEIKVRDFIKAYLDNEECHEAGSLLVLEPMKYLNTAKFMKCFVEHDEEELRKNFSEDEIDKIMSVDKFLLINCYRVYMSTFLTSMFSFDTNRDFMEQIEERKEAIKECSFKALATFEVFGDFSSGKLTEDDKEELDKVAKELFKDFNDVN